MYLKLAKAQTVHGNDNYMSKLFNACWCLWMKKQFNLNFQRSSVWVFLNIQYNALKRLKTVQKKLQCPYSHHINQYVCLLVGFYLNISTETYSKSSSCYIHIMPLMRRNINKFHWCEINKIQTKTWTKL